MTAAGECHVRWLSSGALVETQQSTKPLDAFYRADREELDDGILLAADPASHGGNEDLPGLKGGGHPLILPTCRDSEQLSTGWQAG